MTNLKNESLFEILINYLAVIVFITFSLIMIMIYTFNNDETELLVNDTIENNEEINHWTDWFEEEQLDAINEIDSDWSLKSDEFIVNDDFSKMSLVIDSIWVSKEILDTNWKWIRNYYVTIRKNLWLEWSFPWEKWKTLIWAHSSKPIFNPLWIQDTFKDLEKVKIWDEVKIITNKYEYVYTITNSFKWKKWKNENWILNFTKTNQLLLHTCPAVDDTWFWKELVFVEAKLIDIKEIILDKQIDEWN